MDSKRLMVVLFLPCSLVDLIAGGAGLHADLELLQVFELGDLGFSRTAIS